MAKASSKKTGKTKKELFDDAIAEAVGAGKELHLESVDFSDPNRPKTCLEVDFPILPINQVACIEGNAGKPIYQMSKWWARRRSSVFRSMLIAAATKAPDDPGEAAKLVWDSYYGNHQKNEVFKKLKVADIFMGGGTTIVEGARLGMQMFGNDLNPVAWFVVKNELAQVDPAEVQKLLDQVEAEVKPQIMPFYACDCPRGHKGKWTQRSTSKVMGKSFDPFVLKSSERADYEYEGPEVIYTFWAKHLPCNATGCRHRTPIISSPLVAVKTVTVKVWADRSCKNCTKEFDVEQHNARMAPAATLVVSPDEKPFAAMDDSGKYTCPHCGHSHHDTKAKDTGDSGSLGKARNKSVELSLLVHPRWLLGSSGTDPSGQEYGGSVSDSADSTVLWLKNRCQSLALIEVRGKLPDQINLADWPTPLYTDDRGGNVPEKAAVSCKEETCGRVQDVLGSIEAFGKTGPVAPYMIHGHCPECDEGGLPYGGRFFDIAHAEPLTKAVEEWDQEKDHLFNGIWPTATVQLGLETSVRTPLQKYQYKRWVDFFNPRQLVVLCTLLKSLLADKARTSPAWLLSLAAFQQYLRNQNMFCIWDISRDCMAPFLSKNNLHPPNRPVENGVFNRLGRGNWQSCGDAIQDALTWLADPWEILPVERLKQMPDLDSGSLTGKSAKIATGDPVLPGSVLTCGSSTALSEIPSESMDVVITDPPFGDIMQYSELSSFFYVWLRPTLGKEFPTLFSAELPPSALEAVENGQRHGKKTNEFYNRVLKWEQHVRRLRFQQFRGPQSGCRNVGM